MNEHPDSRNNDWSSQKNSSKFLVMQLKTTKALAWIHQKCIVHQDNKEFSLKNRQ